MSGRRSRACSKRPGLEPPAAEIVRKRAGHYRDRMKRGLEVEEQSISARDSKRLQRIERRSRERHGARNVAEDLSVPLQHVETRWERGHDLVRDPRARQLDRME